MVSRRSAGSPWASLLKSRPSAPDQPQVWGDVDLEQGALMTPRTRTTTHPWTAAQEHELRRLARANTPPADIAARLARTPEQVFERAYELGLNLPRAQ
jgi:hypothetical protein